MAGPDATVEFGAAVVGGAHMAMVGREGASAAADMADMRASQATDMRAAKPAAADMSAPEAAAHMAAAPEAAAHMAAATEAAAPVATAAATTVATTATATAPAGQGVGRYGSCSQRDSRDQDDCSM
jgi:hypothetical protein